MLVFLDTEFTGLQKDTQLISIGLVSEDGKEFYAEIGGINTNVQDEWIKENVLANTAMYGEVDITNIVLEETDYHKGNKEDIKQELVAWLNQFDDVEIVSDVCHYDFVLFIDIFGSAFDLPENVCAACHDINQDIGSYYSISNRSAFDFSREDILEEHGITIKGDKHNSLYDARVIRALYEVLHSK